MKSIIYNLDGNILSSYINEEDEHNKWIKNKDQKCKKIAEADKS